MEELEKKLVKREVDMMEDIEKRILEREGELEKTIRKMEEKFE